jgi:hypothetical protein
MHEDRPRYLTSENVQAEAEVAKAVAERYGLHVEKLSEWAYRLDYALVKKPGWLSEVVGYLEVKDRPKLTIGSNSGYMIASHKLAFARVLTEGTDMKAILAVRAAGREIWITDLKQKPLKVILAGRRDRGTVGDIEPMAVLPWSTWRKL